MGSYRVIHAGKSGTEAFSDYVYDVLLEDLKVAEVSHSYRGEDFHVRQPNGEWIATDRVIEGGGPEPLRLSAKGKEVISRLVERR